jgi:hypothetical protein
LGREVAQQSLPVSGEGKSGGATIRRVGPTVHQSGCFGAVNELAGTVVTSSEIVRDVGDRRSGARSVTFDRQQQFDVALVSGRRRRRPSRSSAGSREAPCGKS